MGSRLTQGGHAQWYSSKYKLFSFLEDKVYLREKILRTVRRTAMACDPLPHEALC
jgi:hypothetical protein